MPRGCPTPRRPGAGRTPAYEAVRTRAGLTGGAAAAEDGGGRVRLLSPRLLRAHLPFGLLQCVSFIRFIMVPSGNMGVFDPTEIHNRGQLKSHMKEAMIKLGFHLLCFFMYLYSMILALIND
ncbi:PREDICTED: protein cornichon homolog 4 [Dipodomys ordii]|uniref:Protein cornichon homolog 4 n=1 Tax=Dipodomys ordii TaxID=10020 RepID=A0A1S3GUJ6_DIPOR|nr:PREDICTED: protein cornichon homolog 4 [Dipodomys ordii]